MQFTKLNAFATRYTAAWCSQNAANVASFFSPSGSLHGQKGAYQRIRGMANWQ